MFNFCQFKTQWWWHHDQNVCWRSSWQIFQNDADKNYKRTIFIHFILNDSRKRYGMGVRKRNDFLSLYIFNMKKWPDRHWTTHWNIFSVTVIEPNENMYLIKEIAATVPPVAHKYLSIFGHFLLVKSNAKKVVFCKTFVAFLFFKPYFPKSICLLHTHEKGMMRL